MSGAHSGSTCTFKNRCCPILADCSNLHSTCYLDNPSPQVFVHGVLGRYEVAKVFMN
jgi:hypothetical protein